MRLSRIVFAAILVASTTLAAAATPPKAAIASAHYLATEAGFEVLEEGGNAFDAAIAVSAALAVVEPASSGLGGGAFWLLHVAEQDRDVMIDAREMAPAAATRDMYLDAEGNVDRDKAVNGPLAAGIPGHAAGMIHMADQYGRLPLSKSLAPAIRLAREGFPADAKYVRLMSFRAGVISRWPQGTETFLNEGEVPAEGWIVKQPDLARTLELIADKGFDGFYKGELADKLVSAVQEAGGIWTKEDLAGYHIKEREPIRVNYRGMQIVTASPPSSGGIALATMLNILEGYDLDAMDSVQRTHLIVESMRRAYRDRTLYLGDPDFVDIPVARLTNPFYADGLRAAIRKDRATPSELLPGIESEAEGTDTSHFSLIDTEGNRVAATLTVNLPYGCGFVAPGTGFLLNNEMDDFSAKEGVPNAYGLLGEEANAIAPFKRPLSSMTPTIIESERGVAVLGTPGGSRIITMVLLGLLEYARGEGPEAWVSLPRFHHQYLPDKITFEPDALTPELLNGLQELGHTVEAYQRTWGNMHGVMWDADTGQVEAASDPRWPSGRGMVK